VKIARTSEAEPVPLQAEWFTGEGIRRDVTRIGAPDAGLTVVSFEPSARTNWHSHSDGQVLFVLDGAGRTATRREAEVPLAVGDVVYVAPGEEHWHGATESSSMRHLAVSFGQTDWLEPVDDPTR